MRIHICAHGRLKSGPEKALYDDYTARFDRGARGLGFSAITLHETDERKSSSSASVLTSCPTGATRVLLDERGTQMTSLDFAGFLEKLRDQGRQDLAVCIGAADGFDQAARNSADHLLSFGHMVWPHMLARVMLAEQLYRASSILSCGPYHRA